VTVRDRLLRFVGRLDLYYQAQRLGLEYDGATHRETLAEDNRRQNRLLEAGVRLLRFTAGDIFNAPDLVVSQVRTALAT
jgi:very-short-patch-repair endonuclease